MSRDEENNDPAGDEGLKTDPIHGASPGGEKRPKEDGQKETMPSDEPRQLASVEDDKIVKICKACMVSQNDGGDYCSTCGEKLDSIRSVRDSCIGDVVGDKYRIVEKIGSGGMGDVYLGLNEPLEQRVAIKFLNKKFTSDEKIVLRFLNEARSYCKVNHPNAVTLLEYGQHDDGSLYLITEYIEGEGLTEVVRESGALSTEVIVSVGVQVCDVLSAAHHQGIIHRDLKPDNLMMIPGSRGTYAVKVLDFGIAKIADDDRDGPKTETGSVFGTPEFMSPEQARGDSADPRSDLYALGVILYYMATARLPFQGKNKFAILNQQLNKQPQPPSSLDGVSELEPGLEQIILRCLAKEADDRPSSADEVAEALESIDWRSPASDVGAHRSPDPAEESGALSAPEDEDGPASDEDVVQPLGMETFDDGGDAEPLDVAFDDDADAMAATIGGELNDELTEDENDSLGRQIDTEEPGGEVIYRAENRFGDSSRLRSAAIGVLATIAVVGAVVFWSAPDTEEPDVAEDSAKMAANVVWDSRSAAVLATVDELVDSGEIADADVVLSAIEVSVLAEHHVEHYDAVIARASRASNTQMQLRATLDARACDQAEGLLDKLAQISAGAAANHRDAVADCGDVGSTERAAADGPSPAERAAPDPPTADEPGSPPPSSDPPSGSAVPSETEPAPSSEPEEPDSADPAEEMPESTDEDGDEQAPESSAQDQKDDETSEDLPTPGEEDEASDIGGDGEGDVEPAPEEEEIEDESEEEEDEDLALPPREI